MAYILALDQGTTSSRAILFDAAGAIAAVAQKEFRQFYPQAGWVEHDPTEILTSQLSCAVEALGKVGARPRDIAAIGITNQRETVIVWERATGKAIYPAIVWQDRRTAALCESLEQSGAGEMVSSKTGLVLDPYFSATKVKWILDNVEGCAGEGRARRASLLELSTDWLIWHLTADGHTHVTRLDERVAHAALQCWSRASGIKELLKLFENSREHVFAGSEMVERARGREVVNAARPWRRSDRRHRRQRPAESGALQPSCAGARWRETKTYCRTGCFLLQNIGTGVHAVAAAQAHYDHRGERAKAGLNTRLKADIFIGGAVVQWLRDNLELIETSADVEALRRERARHRRRGFCACVCRQLSAPHWDAHAAGDADRPAAAAHRAQGTLRAQRSKPSHFQVADVLEAVSAAKPARRCRPSESTAEQR